MNDMTRLVAQQLTPALEAGVEMRDVVALLDGVGPTGPALQQCCDIARKLTRPGSRASHEIHWRRLTRGFAVAPEDLEIFLEIADELGLDLTGHPDDLPMVEDYYAYDEHRPMVIVRPGTPEAGLLTFGMPELVELMDWTRAMALTFGRSRTLRRRDQGRTDFYARGDQAVRNFCTAWNKLYQAAWGKQLISLQTVNPMSLVKRPDREPREKFALSGTQVAEVWYVVNTDDYDPELYAALVKFHLRVGAREEGAINLRLRDLDDHLQAVWVDEKFNKRLPVPVPPGYLDELRALAASRGHTGPDDPVFAQKKRVRDSDGLLVHPPISRHSYVRLHRVIQDGLPWADHDAFGVHWLRGYAAGVILSASNVAVKKRFLRHKHRAAVDRYAPADFKHVAWAVGRAYGFQHPQGEPYPWDI